MDIKQCVKEIRLTIPIVNVELEEKEAIELYEEIDYVITHSKSHGERFKKLSAIHKALQPIVPEVAVRKTILVTRSDIVVKEE